MILSSVSAYIVTVIVIGYPIFIVIFLTINIKRLKDESFELKYDELYDELDISNKYAILYNAIYCLRRVIIAFFGVYLTT
jgi:hypothetical protein